MLFSISPNLGLSESLSERLIQKKCNDPFFALHVFFEDRTYYAIKTIKAVVLLYLFLLSVYSSTGLLINAR